MQTHLYIRRGRRVPTCIHQLHTCIASRCNRYGSDTNTTASRRHSRRAHTDSICTHQPLQQSQRRYTKPPKKRHFIGCFINNSEQKVLPLSQMYFSPVVQVLSAQPSGPNRPQSPYISGSPSCQCHQLMGVPSYQDQVERHDSQSSSVTPTPQAQRVKSRNRPIHKSRSDDRLQKVQ